MGSTYLPRFCFLALYFVPLYVFYIELSQSFHIREYLINFQQITNHDIESYFGLNIFKKSFLLQNAFCKFMSTTFYDLNLFTNYLYAFIILPTKVCESMIFNEYFHDIVYV